MAPNPPATTQGQSAPITPTGGGGAYDPTAQTPTTGNGASASDTVILRRRTGAQTGAFPARFGNSLSVSDAAFLPMRMTHGERVRLQRYMKAAGLYPPGQSYQPGEWDAASNEAYLALTDEWALYSAAGNDMALEELLDSKLRSQAESFAAGGGGLAGGVQALPDQTVTLSNRDQVEQAVQDKLQSEFGFKLPADQIGAVLDTVLAREESVLVGQAARDRDRMRATAVAQFQAENGVLLASPDGTMENIDILTGGDEGQGNTAHSFLQALAGRYGLTIVGSTTDPNDPRSPAFSAGRAMRLAGDPKDIARMQMDLAEQSGSGKVFEFVQTTGDRHNNLAVVAVGVNEGARKPAGFAETRPVKDPTEAFLAAVRRGESPEAYQWGGKGRSGAYAMNPRVYRDVAQRMGIDPTITDKATQDLVARAWANELHDELGSWDDVAAAWMLGGSRAYRQYQRATAPKTGNPATRGITKALDVWTGKVLGRMQRFERGGLPDAPVDPLALAEAMARAGEPQFVGGGIAVNENPNPAAEAYATIERERGGELGARHVVKDWDTLLSGITGSTV